MNQQQIFNVVQARLNDGNGRSMQVDERGITSCKYRAPDGNRCAVGCLIPDDAYRPEMESCTPHTLVREYWDVLPSWFGEHVNLLTALQLVHDEATNWDGKYLGRAGRAQLNIVRTMVDL